MSQTDSVILINPYNSRYGWQTTSDPETINLYQKVLRIASFENLSEQAEEIRKIKDPISLISDSSVVYQLFKKIIQKTQAEKTALIPINLFNPLNPCIPTSLTTSDPTFISIYFRLLEVASASSEDLDMQRELMRLEIAISSLKFDKQTEPVIRFLKTTFQEIKNVQLIGLADSIYFESVNFEKFKDEFKENFERKINDPELSSFIFSKSQKIYANLIATYPTTFDENKRFLTFLALVLILTKLYSDNYKKWTIDLLCCMPLPPFRKSSDSYLKDMISKITIAELILLRFLDFIPITYSEIDDINTQSDEKTKSNLIEFEKLANFILSAPLPIFEKDAALIRLSQKINNLPITTYEIEKNITLLIKRVKKEISTNFSIISKMLSIHDRLNTLMTPVYYKTISTLEELENIANFIISEPLETFDKQNAFTRLEISIKQLPSANTEHQEKINLLIKRVQKEELINKLECLRHQFLINKINDLLANSSISDDDKYYALFLLYEDANRLIQESLNLQKDLDKVTILKYEISNFIALAKQFQDSVKEAQLKLWPTSYY